ncbi:hypothetical protein [Winogradskyella vincentii]|uniref:Beta-lactamase-inhibitor-like, PepSY-like n=1 Tax=Winogradskyella vincentii TaxID=2877122 RepID=A0ABS7Y3L1_9FLAO|nr:hypothetical protein [Winogradskyella vincentii]MCA0153268.1 hypothetical protein [Winogradskyella vincentii]
MRNLITICFIFILTVSFSQEKEIDIHYVVDYTMPSKRNTTVDTISIGYNKEGKYLWTNYNKLALSLAKSLIKDNKRDYEKATSHIIYHTEQGVLTLLFELGNNSIFFNLDLDSFLPSNEFSSDENESLDLITEDTGETVKILDKDAKVYLMFPGNAPDDIVSMAVDEDYEVNNNEIFKRFFELAFQKTGLQDEFAPEMPNGLIMKIFENDNSMIEAIKVVDKKKTIKINYSFKITE